MQIPDFFVVRNSNRLTVHLNNMQLTKVITFVPALEWNKLTVQKSCALPLVLYH